MATKDPNFNPALRAGPGPQQTAEPGPQPEQAGSVYDDAGTAEGKAVGNTVSFLGSRA